jgi:hypothetical protein
MFAGETVLLTTIFRDGSEPATHHSSVYPNETQHTTPNLEVRHLEGVQHPSWRNRSSGSVSTK